jgi:cytochrome oxidase Cu insertion factor (SCO1/SenC/PrrC family)
MNENNTRLTNRFIVVLIILIFSAPLIGSWLLLNYMDNAEEHGKGNHGVLIDPPRPLPNIKLIDPLSETNQGQLQGKWSMLYIVENRCDEVCIENLYRMRQIRLATGKHYQRVQRVLLLQQGNTDGLKQIFKDYSGQWLMATENINMNELLDNFRAEPSENPAQKQRLYLVDPLGNLMMRYPLDTDPIGIIKDLNRLLKASHIG